MRDGGPVAGLRVQTVVSAAYESVSRSSVGREAKTLRPDVREGPELGLEATDRILTSTLGIILLTVGVFASVPKLGS